jgi:MFS family permease
MSAWSNPEVRTQLRRILGSFAPPEPREPSESRAFREHLLASAWGGFSAGIVLLTDVILAKTLGAAGWQVTLLATLGPAANLGSFYWASQVQGRRKGSFFLLAGVLGRLPLVLLLIRSTTWWLIALNFLYAVATALVVTASNAIFQTRYPGESRAHLFGLATSVSAICTIVGVQGAGLILDRHEGAYPWLFAFAGVAGVVSAFHMFRMESIPTPSPTAAEWLRRGWQSARRRLVPAAGGGRIAGPGESVRLARRVLRENPGFVHFEQNYMIYGFAFMMLLPVLPLYVVKELKMDYHQLAAAKGMWSQVGVVLLSPALGLALRRLQPLRFTGRAFLLLALYPLCLLVSTMPGLSDRVSWVYAALFFFSIAMAGVNLSWTLGSMHFAGDEDASVFQGVHVALTGVRGLLAPAFGFVVYKILGSGAVFALSAALFTTAGLLMLRRDQMSTREVAVES